MNEPTKSLSEVRRQLGTGTILMLLGVIWFCVILYGMRPDQILPTNENVHTAVDALKAQLSIPFKQWDMDATRLVVTKFIVLLVTDIIFVITRYGGLTLFFLGGFTIFDAISKAPRASR
jgi:hypothetical protein